MGAWGEGSPSSLKPPRPPSTIHRLFLYIMYKVEGAEAMAMEGGSGAMGGGTVTK